MAPKHKRKMSVIKNASPPTIKTSFFLNVSLVTNLPVSIKVINAPIAAVAIPRITPKKAVQIVTIHIAYQVITIRQQ